LEQIVKHKISLGLLVMVISGSGFAKDGVAKMKEGVQESVEETKEFVSDKKEEFESSIKRELSKLEVEIEKLKESSKDASEEVKNRSEESLKDLQKKRGELEKRLAELSKSSESKWRELKRGVLKALEELKVAFRRSGPPDCTGKERWPASMAYVQLKNEGVLTPEKTLHSKTKVSRLVSEQIGKDLFRQVHEITFFEKSGKEVQVMTVSDSSQEECSMGEVTVYQVFRKL
jgi:hypothetical protein